MHCPLDGFLFACCVLQAQEGLLVLEKILTSSTIGSTDVSSWSITHHRMCRRAAIALISLFFRITATHHLSCLAILGTLSDGMVPGLHSRISSPRKFMKPSKCFSWGSDGAKKFITGPKKQQWFKTIPMKVLVFLSAHQLFQLRHEHRSTILVDPRSS